MEKLWKRRARIAFERVRTIGFNEVMGSEQSSFAPPPNAIIYKNKLFFFPDLDQWETHTISSQHLETRLEELIDIDQVITLVALYKSPMNDESDTSGTLHHFFVFFKTQGWWWSIEKNHEGVFMQRSKDLTDVLLHCAGESRTHPINNVRWADHQVVKANSQSSVRQLVQLIVDQNHLDIKYDSFKDVGFAANIFNSIKSDGAVF